MSRPKSIIVLDIGYRNLSDRFYEYLKRLGFVKKTSRTSQLNINEFLSYLEKKGRTKIEEIQPHEIQSFYNYLSERPSKTSEGILSQKTTFHCMKSIDHLFRMLQSAGEIKANPISTLKFNYPRLEPQRDILSQEEIKQLYEFCESAWEQSILSLAYGCGLRVGELDQVDIEDIRLREKIIIIPKGKGNKRRVVPMSPGVVNDLSDYYFNERQFTNGKDIKDDKAFMLNSRGGRLKEWTYNKQLKKMIGRIENKQLHKKEITMHSLRHSIATHLIQQGIPVEQVRQFLGHSQLETTQVYTHISKQQLKDLIKDKKDDDP